MQSELQERSDILASNLQRSINACFEVLQSVSSLFAASKQVEHQDFQRFVQPALARHPSIQALEWLPRLQDGDRPQFEQTMQQAGWHDFYLLEQDETGKLVKAASRPEYFPVLYAEPLASNESALGYDLGSDLVRRDALLKARDSGTMTLSGRIELIQDTQSQAGFLAILPVYWEGMVPESIPKRQAALRGFLLGVFRLVDVIDSALAGLNLNTLDFYLYDRSKPSSEGLLAIFQCHTRQILAGISASRLESLQGTEAPFHRGDRPHCSRPFQVADRQWLLVLVPTDAYIDRDALYYQSRLQADAAEAEAKKLKQVLQNLQHTQARWLREKTLIAIGVGLVLLILGSANLVSCWAIARLLQNQPQFQTSLHTTLLINLLSLPVSIALLIGVYALLQRQMNERQQVESALVEANSQLKVEVQQRLAELEQTREISDLKMRLFSMVSHEFRTPLSTILISTQLLASSDSQALDERKAKNLHRIQTAAKTLAQLLSDILTLNRAEAGKLDFQPEFLELQPFCHQVLEALQPSDAAPRSIQVALPGNFTTAYVDPKLFHSIVTNLLSNALKYSPPDSRVNLTLQRTSQALIVQVQDWGIGIPAEDQPRLYDVFHRGQNVGVVTGTGLGLAVVKTCVDLHGGRVEVESQVGIGTTFTVTIPQ